MFEIFKKTFIKGYKNTSDTEVRFRYGIVAGIFGIITNALLCAMKIAVGLLAGSVSIIADAINNLSDAGASVVTLVGFKLSSRPADNEHPYGHARYEYIAGMIISVLVLFIGLILMKSSIEKIISSSEITVSVYTYVILGIAIFGKVFQGLLYRNFAKSINSETLRANAIDSRNDVITTAAVLISTTIIGTTGYNVDGYMGIAVSLFIIISSFKMLKDIINPLLGNAPDKEFVGKISSKLLSYDIVYGFHDLMIHSYGPAICFASVHVEVDSCENVMDIHDHIDNIERDFMRDMNIHLVIHMDPVAIDDPETNMLKEQVVAALKELDESLTIHDFRLVKGTTHTNVLFDVVVLRGRNYSARSIREYLETKLQDGNTYYFVIDIDNSFV